MAHYCIYYLSLFRLPKRRRYLYKNPRYTQHSTSSPQVDQYTTADRPLCQVKTRSIYAAPGYSHTTITEGNGKPFARMNPRTEYEPYWLPEDWVNLCLVFYPTQSVVSRTKVVLSGIGPS